MISIITPNNILAINNIAEDMMALLKKHKIFLVSEFNPDDRVKASSCMYLIDHAMDDRLKSFKLFCDDESAVPQLILQRKRLASLLESEDRFTSWKIKDYAGDIKPKLCRELISELEDMFIMGDIQQADIVDVYSTLDKPLPKKFTLPSLNDKSEKVCQAIMKVVSQQAQTIKQRSITHYMNMVDRIDPEDEYKTVKAFYIAGRKKISDFMTLRLCLSCKFTHKKFLKLIDDEFEALVIQVANRITSHSRTATDNPKIEVSSIQIGGKGFDVTMTLDGVNIYARAIPVEGYFVRFHYRYIIT